MTRARNLYRGAIMRPLTTICIHFTTNMMPVDYGFAVKVSPPLVKVITIGITNVGQFTSSVYASSKIEIYP